MDATFAALQDLQPPVWVRVLLMVAVLGLVTSDVFIGRKDHRRLVDALAAENDAADAAGAEVTRARFLYRWVRLGWATALAAMLLVWLLPGVNPVNLGLRVPDFGRLMPSAASNSDMSTL